MARGALDDGAAGVAEAEEPGHLVEGLARGVIEGLAQEPVAAGALHGHEQGVSSRDQEHGHGPLDAGVVEEGGEKVALEVVDADEGQAPGQGERLGLAHPHQQ